MFSALIVLSNLAWVLASHSSRVSTNLRVQSERHGSVASGASRALRRSQQRRVLTNAGGDDNSTEEDSEAVTLVGRLDGYESVKCQDLVESGKRLLLMEVTAPFHGSTALAGVLMSSSNLSTLCSYGTNWECEGSWIMEDQGWDKHISTWQDFGTVLQSYSEFWDLQRPILLEKTPNRIDAVEKEFWGLKSAPLPPKMVEAAVKELQPVYVFTWRPPCLAALSSHAQETLMDKGLEHWTHWELIYYQELVDAHKFLLQQGIPVLVINIADLMWQQERTQQRIEHFLPCLGRLDFTYQPKTGEDVFSGNLWKLEGSLRSFSEKNQPLECCGYEVDTAKCIDPDKWPELNSPDKEQAEELMEYLLALS